MSRWRCHAAPSDPPRRARTPDRRVKLDRPGPVQRRRPQPPPATCSPSQPRWRVRVPGRRVLLVQRTAMRPPTKSVAVAAITAPTVVAIPSMLVKPMSAIGALSAVASMARCRAR